MHRTTISLPEDLAKLVEDEARRRQTSVSDVIRSSVREMLASSQRRQLAVVGVCDSPDLPSGSRLDEVLTESWADDLDPRTR